ncbi:MAG: hypothetical protein GX488_03990 [Clostridiales bacterium]|nr:hypothetical protein [Clostridiales bacterium]
MNSDNKMKSTRNKKKEDEKFRSKHIKHDPNAESARAVFGLSGDGRSDRHRKEI